MTVREEYINDTSAPIAVHDPEYIRLYHTLDVATKIAWNEYAQDAADEFDKNCDTYDTTNAYWRWTPCDFKEWLEYRRNAMTYQIPMKDGEIDYESMACAISIAFMEPVGEKPGAEMLKTLVNHALEGAAKIVKLYPANKTTADIVREIRALKEPTDD